MSPLIGEPLDRTDGLAKVTGAARYAAEFAHPGLVHGVLVTSTIARGTIASIDNVERVQAMPGVLLVMTWQNAPRLPGAGKSRLSPPAGRHLSLLQDNEVRYSNEPVAVIVADTLERATDAARRLRITYAAQPAALDFAHALPDAYAPTHPQGRQTDTARGDLDAGMREATVHVEAVYTTPIEHHNPMEPHATMAQWDGARLTLYDATQGVTGAKNAIAATLGIAPENVRVLAPFLGGGFGCKGSSWSHVALCAMAARQVGRPVRLVLERPQMFGPVGARPRTQQHIRLAARADGTLTAMRHDSYSDTSTFEDWTETCCMVSRMLYAVPNQVTTHRLVRLNVGTPTFMRAPGEATGSFALESAMDELAVQLDMDPLALRLKNDTQVDPSVNRPFSARALRTCYEVGAERFGWSQRPAAPRATRRGDTLIGYGLGTATYPANRNEAAARARIFADGTAEVESGTQDLGTGTYTVMTQVAADALGFAPHDVRFVLGDSSLPKAPGSGGSQTAASVSPAVRDACTQARARLIALASADPASPVHGLAPDALAVEDGWVVSRTDATRRVAAATLVARAGAPVDVRASARPGAERETYAFHSFGAVFVEAHVDALLGTIRMPRVVAVYDVGRILNHKTARSQLMGGLVWGIGAALEEQTLLDTRYGRFTNANLAEYHVPVNADIGELDVTFLDQPDPHINSLGVRGIGEIGITGVVAALANAVWHATGVRVRDLPITLDKLMV
jgi:xanthine dehydrogenase YagR molybdenum-binding subunit